jgi:trans-aconitate methyltransferase
LALNGNEIILDLGCGDGVLTERLASLVPDGEVIGVDASVGMINTAKKVEKSNLSFVYMDINSMNFDNCFDVIFSNSVVHWIKDQKLLLENCLLALKTNGFIKWNFGSEKNASNFISTVKTVMNDDAYKKYFTNFEWPWFMPPKTEYEKIISNVGFREISIAYENEDKYFHDCDEMIEWIDTAAIVPFIQHLPDTQKESIRNSVISIMIEKTRQADGRYFETFRRLNVKAIK